MSNHSWKIDGNKELSNMQATVVWETDRFFTIQHKNQHFHGELIEEQLENRLIKVKINHREFTVSKDGPLDALIEELGLNVVKVRKLKQLKSPMPGRIVAIAVEIGQEIELGTELLTLEAMKMENVLKSEGIGKVKSIDIIAGDVVDKGSVLISFE
ncbi:MAG: acetyl-CoA carboxylase biotin carboxyl carrier protein subunit [Bacteroidota bacterium]